jgi:hypothetical protein
MKRTRSGFITRRGPVPPRGLGPHRPASSAHMRLAHCTGRGAAFMSPSDLGGARRDRPPARRLEADDGDASGPALVSTQEVPPMRRSRSTKPQRVTNRNASNTIGNDIFDLPRVRAAKVMGNSITRPPRRQMRWVISIWKA